jgi:hypothetical protein
MSTIVQPTLTTPTTATRPARRTSTTGYWLAGMIAVVGLVVGVTLGLTSYRDAQRHIDTFDRVAIPGMITVRVDEPAGRVVYYEGDDTVRFDDLTIRVTATDGTAVDVSRYEGELIYETLDGTKGRAVASFTAERPGAYTVDVSGVETGHLTVGDSFSRRALPGVLTALGIAATSVIAGLVLWLITFINRSNQRRAIEPGARR